MTHKHDRLIYEWLGIHKARETRFKTDIHRALQRQQRTVHENLAALAGTISPNDADKLLPHGQPENDIIRVANAQIARAATRGALNTFNRIARKLIQRRAESAAAMSAN